MKDLRDAILFAEISNLHIDSRFFGRTITPAIFVTSKPPFAANVRVTPPAGRLAPRWRQNPTDSRFAVIGYLGFSVAC
jgi:hypothetical protein